MIGSEAAAHHSSAMPPPRTVAETRYDQPARFAQDARPRTTTAFTSANPATNPATPHRQRTDTEANDHRPRRPPLVSADELAILRLVADGLPTDAVAHRLTTSPRTVRRRMRNLCDRVGATCTIQAVVWAARHGLV